MFNSKSPIRKEMLLHRLKLSDEVKKTYDKQIYKQLIALEIINKARIIGTYLSMKSEVDTREFIKHIFKLKKPTIVIPRVVGENLNFYKISNFNYLVKSAMGILEPPLTFPKIEVKDIDIFIAPGLAFTIDGYRIGYGKGYYDRVFAQTKAFTIGLAYEFALLEKIPYKTYDKKVDLIITPEKLLYCAK